jgi:ABC-type branched-subunit amino acid transport system ATPase component
MALLEARAVSVRYAGVVAADEVSIGVDPGELVGLIGPNGAGKTTVLGVLSGSVRPSAGRVVFDGRDVTEWPPERRAADGLARTFQRLELFRTMTVHDNLLVAAEAQFAEAEFVADVMGRRRRGRAADVAASVGDRLGLRPVAGRLAAEVPLGLGRLVEIARALCTGPRILLLDEPASGLDEAETLRLRDVLREIARDDGLGILLVEHDLSLVMDLCDRVAVMDFGTLIADGSPDDVRADAAVQAAYLGTDLADLSGEVRRAGAARG